MEGSSSECGGRCQRGDVTVGVSFGSLVLKGVWAPCWQLEGRRALQWGSPRGIAGQSHLIREIPLPLCALDVSPSPSLYSLPARRWGPAYVLHAYFT